MKPVIIEMGRVGTSWKDVEAGDTIVLRKGIKETVISIELQSEGAARFKKSPVIVHTDKGVSYLDRDLRYQGDEDHPYDVVQIIKAQPVPKMVDSLSEGDTVVYRNGETQVVVAVHRVEPNPKTFNNPILLTFVGGNYGYFTEELNLYDAVESPLDIVSINKETTAIVNELYNPTQHLIDSVRAQVTVKVVREQGYVTITPIEEGYEEVFLQGDEADSFIKKSLETYSLGCLPLYDCYLFHANEYLDVIFHP